MVLEQQNNPASGSGDPFGEMSNNPMMMMFMRRMMPEMFGVEPERSLWDDAVPVGLTQVGGQTTVGVISIMVLAPTKDNPVARLRVVTNGPCDGTPSKLRRIGEAFLAWAEDKELAKALVDAKALESQQLVGGVVMGGKK